MGEIIDLDQRRKAAAEPKACVFCGHKVLVACGVRSYAPYCPDGVEADRAEASRFGLSLEQYYTLFFEGE